MKKVLVINSSASGNKSHSRKLTEVFIDHWKSIHTNPVIRFRELGNTHVPHIDEHWIAAAYYFCCFQEVHRDTKKADIMNT